MISAKQSRELVQAIVGVLGNPVEGAPEIRYRQIPRPPLAALPTWKGFDLQALASVRPHSDFHWVALAELFAAYIEQYFTEEQTDTHPFAYLKTEMRLERYGAAYLFPVRRGQANHQDKCYGLAVLLHWIAQAGYTLDYASDRLLVHGEEQTIGVSDARVLCHYQTLCVSIEGPNWAALLEESREGGDVASVDMFHLYLRSKNERLEHQAGLHRAVQVLHWAGAKHRRDAEARLPHRHTQQALRKQLDTVLTCADPVRALQGVLVPQYVSRSKYQRIVKPYRFRSALWERQDLISFINTVLAHTDLALTFRPNNNKRIQSHANRPHRQGKSG